MPILSKYTEVSHMHVEEHVYTFPMMEMFLHHFFSRSEYVFNFDNAFELHNDIEVLKKMGLDCGLHSGTCTAEDIKTAKSMLPKAFASTLDGECIHPTFTCI